MPSSPNYVRDYEQEARTSHARGEDPKRLARIRARRRLQKRGLVHPFDGKDVDHIKPLSKGGSNDDSNLRVRDDNANRSFPRRPDGSMIANRTKSHAKKR